MNLSKRVACFLVFALLLTQLQVGFVAHLGPNPPDKSTIWKQGATRG